MSTYRARRSDRVVPLEELPPSSAGAPLPTVVGDEDTVVVAYLISNRPEDRDVRSVRMVAPESSGEPVALVSFRWHRAVYFGAPNDEAFSGHPLAKRGLRPYGSFEVKPSSWIRQLERMNSVHPQHSPDDYRSLRHFALTFHDSTFECVAESFEVEIHNGSIRSVVPRMTELLDIR